MSVRTDVINLNVNVNGNKAQNDLNDLRKKAADVRLEMENLKRGTQAYIDKKNELKQVTQAMDELKKQMGLTALTQKELTAELTKLKALKGSVQPFTQEFKDLQKQIEAVENRLYDVRNGVTGFASVFSKVKDEVKQFGMMAAAYLGFQFITSQFQSIILGAGKLSDSLADIQRVTGMTKGEVKSLNAELTALDTRTSTEGLRNIAIVAGKLGVAKQDILEFVKATDMLVVALGDELGNADEITTQLGKIINVFDKGDGKVTGEKLSEIGNAIVDLANKGVATGGFIVDFTQRLGGLAKTANLSLDAVMGLAAGLEESGQKVEASSTAIQKILGQIAADVPKFAQVAGKSVEEFSKTLREKPVEAMIQVSEGFTKGKSGFEEISKAFANAGEDGARMVSTLGVIGSKSDFFRAKIRETGFALKNTGEITEAFDLKNQTLGATIDKLGKDFNRLMTSSYVTNFLKSAINGASELIKWLKDLPNWLEQNRTSLILVTGVILAYVAAKTKATQAIILNKIATLLETAADKLEAAQKAVNIGLTRAYAFAKAVLTGQITLATAAQRVWNFVSASSGNILSIVILAVTALAAAYSFFASKINEVTAAQRVQAELQKKITDLTGEEEAKAQSLYKTLQSTALGYDAKKKLLKDLIAINPEYLSGLNMENIATQQGADIMKTYIANLHKMNEEKARQMLIMDKEKQLLDVTNETTTADSNLKGHVNRFGMSGLDYLLNSDVKASTDGKAKIKQLNDELKVLYDESAKAMTDSLKKDGGYVDNTGKLIKTVAATTIKSIKDQISGLDNAYESIDVHNMAALKQNREARKKLQDELDQLEGKGPKKSKAEKKEENAYAKLKKEAEQFKKDIKKLKDDNDAEDAGVDEKEVVRIQQKYAELMRRAEKYFAAHITTKSQFDQQEIELDQMKWDELNRISKKQEKKALEKEYQQAQDFSTEFFDEQRTQAGKNYATGLTDKKEYELKLKHIESQEADNRVLIARNYSSNVKKAAEDVTKFAHDQSKKQTADEIAEADKRKEIADQEKLAKAKLGVLQTRPNSDARLLAQKALLQAQFELDTQYMDKKSDMYKEKEAELQEAIKALNKAAILAKIEDFEKYAVYFSQALGSLNQMLSNSENKQLAQDRKANTAKKNEYKKQLDGKLLNQTQYDKKIQAMDDEQARLEADARRKQAEREKALNIFNAIISTAAAIAKALPDIPLSIAVGILGGMQVAAIANTPIPEMGTGGLLDEGPYHKDSDKGLHVVDPRTGKTKMLLERDEAVVKGDAIRDRNQYTVTGTPSQITSALNKMHGGVNWAGGAVVQMPKWRTERPASINPGMVRIMEQGGVVRTMNGDQGSGNSDGEHSGLLRELIAEQRQTREDIRNWRKTVKAVVSIKEYREEEKKYDDSKKLGGL